MNEIILNGCASTSLSMYLKGIGIHRLVAEQLDASARCYWKNGCFTLLSRITRDELRKFFLYSYRPTPIISPWSGRAGFLEGDAGEQSTRKGAKILRNIEHSSGSRFYGYRQIVGAIRRVSVIERLDKVRSEVKKLEQMKKSGEIDSDGLQKLSGSKKEVEKLKDNLLIALRAELDDVFMPWIDACFVLAGGEGIVAPLLGSGGNEGSMDFSINHVEYLLKLIDADLDAPTDLSEQLINNALFDEVQYMESTSNIGFLSVASTGGPNMSSGFEGSPKENIWNSVLVMEGVILFATSATKKFESGDKAGLSYPFMVHPTFAGNGSIGANESARPELWLPVWSDPAAAAEVNALFSEGRSTSGIRQARSGLDMLEAVSSLGVNRGVSIFERYGFFERRGKGYFVACHLGSYLVPQNKKDFFIINELNRYGWLSDFRKFANGGNSPHRFLKLRRQLEDRLFDLSDHEPSRAEMQSLLILLGEIQQAMAASSKARESVNPIPRLSERWVIAADDGTPAFRIAMALAGLRGVGDEPLPLRAQLFPVHRRYDQWMTPDADEKVRICTGQKGRLVDTLRTLLERRLWLVEKLEMKDKPLSSPAGVTLDDVNAFLQDDRMDARIAALLPGLSLCAILEDTDRMAGEGVLPAAFGVMKLTLAPDRTLRSLGYLSETERLPIPAGMLAQLAAGNHNNRAVDIAWRRLRVSGLTPFSAGAIPALIGIKPLRAAAALLIPLRCGAIATLARTLLEKSETEADSATIV